MRLARSPASLPPLPQGCVATIGNFDGVHLGHRGVIENLADHGRRLNLPVVVVVFEPQPREYFFPDQCPPRLTRLREKLIQLGGLPVDQVLLLRFNRNLADLPAANFIRDILIDRLGVKYLVVGDDFRFGRGREGDFALLRQAGQRHGFEVSDTPPILVERHRVSSTLVRQALAQGDMAAAARFLGRPYAICGRIGHGSKVGRQLGFPTANIALLRKSAPLSGVFAVTMTGIAGHPLEGVANVGARPTLDREPRVLLETHLFDFDGDLYGRRVEVHFHRKLREERRFADVHALREQIARDSQDARAFFAFEPKKN